MEFLRSTGVDFRMRNLSNSALLAFALQPGPERCVTTSAVIAESVELAHEFSNRVLRRSGTNSQGLGCRPAATGPDPILQGRSSGFARAIARPLPRSISCVRYSRRLGHD